MNNAYIRAQQCKVKEAKFPFVKIGTQYWTTKNLSLSVTPQKTIIPEMQTNANVEKITNIADREFSSDTGFWSKDGNATISNGVCSFSSTSGEISGISKSILTADKFYKFSIDVISLTGSIKIQASVGNSDNNIYTINNTGTITGIIKSGQGNQLFINRSGISSATIDNISIQEIGWSGSQELYDGIYAQTSGTVEQKTYAAVKAAAMWCNYNNDIPTGDIYGKLYNWFAVKLLQMDIAYYNAANPTKPYVWRIPTQAEFQSLSTYLGGDAVSGGHLKEAGTVHWLSPNAGADNSSGFAAIGSSYRTDSIFLVIKDRALIWSIDIINPTTGKSLDLKSNSSSGLITGILYTFGISIRLIKA